MRQPSRLAAIFGAIACLAIPAAPPAMAAASSCDYHLGFKLLHDSLAAQIGSCVDNEAYNARGDSVQHVTGGLLVWRHADNWTAFTDGYHTWVDGPRGIEERLNTDRFAWEHDIVSSSDSSSAAGPPAGNVSSSQSVTSTTSCHTEARSGSVSSTGLNSSTTIISDGGNTTVTSSGNGSSSVTSTATDGGGASTTVISNYSSSSSSPGVASTGC